MVTGEAQTIAESGCKEMALHRSPRGRINEGRSRESQED